MEALDAGPICLQGEEPIGPDDDYGTLSARLERSSGELLVRALDERPPFAEQGEDGLTYAHKIEARDRALDFTLAPEAVERQVRALRPHIGARLPLPGGEFMGVLEARVDGDTLAPAGGRVRVEDGRLLLDCNGGALELTRDPAARRQARWTPAPGCAGAPRRSARASSWTRRCPAARSTSCSSSARAEWTSDAEWAPYLSALAYRGDEEVLFRARAMAEDGDPLERGIAAFLLGQLGTPVRTFPGRVGGRAGGDGRARAGPGRAGGDRARLRPPRRAVRAGHAAARSPRTPSRACARRRRSRSPAARRPAPWTR